MEHLALEIFDLPTQENPSPTSSKFADLPEDTTITITRQSQVFSSGNVWTHSFQLNVRANAHIFGTAGELHGGRLHEQINKRRARLWVEGLPWFLGYLRLGDEVEVAKDGHVDVSFESGQKTFEEMIADTKAREVSVGDVVIGVALNRKRVSKEYIATVRYTLNGLEPYAVKDSRLEGIDKTVFNLGITLTDKTPYVQRWPKLVKSYGMVYNESYQSEIIDYTNVQTPYDAAHPFCNINICYPLKVRDNGEEKAARGYTLRLAHGENTTDGGDNQTRFNNAPNFYLLYFIDRLFKDLKIHIEENQAKDVEDLRRVFLLNFGCFYEEIEDEYDEEELTSHQTPTDKRSRYGQYYMPIISTNDKYSLIKGWAGAGQYTFGDAKGLEQRGKVLLRNVNVSKNGETLLTVGSIEGFVTEVLNSSGSGGLKGALQLDKTEGEEDHLAYSSYLAYATGENFPNVEISEIIKAMESAFGIRFLFSSDYKRVKIVLLRNIFRNTGIQDINCDVVGSPIKEENHIRGFRMTYGKGTEDTNYYYKGFNDLFPRASSAWKDTSDKHDYSKWNLNAEYDMIKQEVSAFNKTCYVTPNNGNAYGIKVDEDEDVLFPSLFNVADFIDAEDGDCTGEDDTIEEVQLNASPVIANEVGNAYAVLFGGTLKAPAPDITGSTESEIDASWKNGQTWLSTYGRVTMDALPVDLTASDMRITGNLDVFVSEGFRIRLLDNYGISNGGTPFDEADPGLCFGIMRSSGSDAHINYQEDTIGNEDNDWWEVVPGSGAIDHPDTCDSYGHEWDYDGSESINNTTEAQAKLAALWPSSNITVTGRTSQNYITMAIQLNIEDENGRLRHPLMVVATANEMLIGPYEIEEYCWQVERDARQSSVSPMVIDASRRKLFVEMDTTEERRDTFLRLQRAAATGTGFPILLDDGVDVRSGRFSLKLRAEKPNPDFDATQPESAANPRYLEITNPNLRGRGLADQFYKEYSYWMRNARIDKMQTHMEAAQLIALDDTMKIHVDDVTGFMLQAQVTVSNKTGLGNVNLDIMYI